MNWTVAASSLGGSVKIPGSKSHTIRALICSLYAHGESLIRDPLISSDTLSGKDMAVLLGADITAGEGLWRVKGRGVHPSGELIDVGNSGTSLYFGIAAAALTNEPVSFTGDEQICRRSAGPLLDALAALGVRVESTCGCTPLTVSGPIRGGRAEVKAVSSQYLSALLLACPCADGQSIIDVPLLNEKPYVEMTLAWLDRCGIRYENHDFSRFVIPGNQSYRTFDASVPSDFSSAAFFLVAGALSDRGILLEGPDYTDTQGDKKVADILRDMGADVEIGEHSIFVKGPLTRGGTFDLNEIPDCLPILAVAGCFAPGQTRLVNVAHARIKETDRISVMRRELAALGADIEELPDGLVISRSELRGATVDGHGDHRIIMALCVAAMHASATTDIRGCDAVAVTFPEFRDLAVSLGGSIQQQ
jgi:3-phosphoshikimate 1-carboxyvinyltransferase